MTSPPTNASVAHAPGGRNGSCAGGHRQSVPIGIAHTVAFVRHNLPRRACRVLEVGCGDGQLAAALQNSRCAVVAIDEDVTAVRMSRRRGVDARRAHWPRFHDGLFDAIVFARSLHECDDLNESVVYAVQQLRPGGRLLVEDFDFAAVSAATVMWLHGVASGLAAARVLPVKHWLVAGLLGKRAVIGVRPEVSQNLQDHDAVRQFLASTGLPLREEVTEYLFRYVETEFPGVQERIRQTEAKLIAAGSIEALGRRFVVG